LETICALGAGEPKGSSSSDTSSARLTAPGAPRTL